MYRKTDERQMEFPGFYMPFSGQLDTENRWITLVKLVPWELVAEIYHATLFEDEGAPIISARVAIGALIIKEHQGLTDRETVKAIQENPYMQYFIGFEEFTNERPFDASLMVDFRKRFGEDGTLKINEAIMLASLQMSEHVDNNVDNADDISTPASESAHGTSPDDVAKSPENRGKLIVDATCTPADIRYPTDVSLLNEAREKMDKVIDELHKPLSGKQRHPRTYREIARRKFVAFTKKKKPGHKAVRKAIREQLGYLKRNLAAIDRLVETPGALPLARLSWQMYKNLLVCRELYRQQLEMYENNTRRIDDRHGLCFSTSEFKIFSNYNMT